MSKRVRSITARASVALATAALISGASLTSRAAVINNAAMEWNEIALNATVTAGQGPVPQARSMTIVQVAVHDAVNTMTRRHSTYLDYRPPPAGASADAAAIAAAHRVLVTLFGTQSIALNAARTASLAARSLTEVDPGISVGENAAAAILAARSNDGASLAQFPYVAPGSGAPGVWVAIGAHAGPAAGLGQCRALGDPHRLRSFVRTHRRTLDGGRWARDYNEVKTIGSLTSTTRTPDSDRDRPVLAGHAVGHLEQRRAAGDRRPGSGYL